MAKEDAIQTDVSQPGDGHETQGQEQEQLSEREMALQGIDEEVANQPDFLVAADELENEGSDADLSKTHEPVVLEPDQLETTLVEVKIDGQVQKLPLSEVTKGYQKDATASRRLEKAAEEQKKLDEQKRLLEEKEAALGKGSDQDHGLSNDDGDFDDDQIDEQISAVMQSLIEGDDEAGAKALKEIIKGRKPATPEIDVNEIVSQASTQAKEALKEEQVQTERSEAWNSFLESNSAFADESSKERKLGDYLFATEFGPKMVAGEMSYQEALTECATRVNEVYPGSAVSGSGQESTTLSRQERKQAIDNVPVAGARAVKPAQASETADDAITAMRKSRGQIT